MAVSGTQQGDGSSVTDASTYPRIGYFVTAYKELPQLRRLLATLLKWDSSGQIALHFDHSKSKLDLDGLVDERLHVLPEWRPVTWGDYSYMQALLHGLRWWSDRRVDWVVILSGQDYPIRRVDELRHFIATSDRNAFIWGGNLGVPPIRYRVNDLDDYRSRYFAHWGKIPRLLWRERARSLTRFGLRLAGSATPGGLLVRDLPHNDRPWVGWRPIRRPPFTPEFSCHIGWDYFAADQHAISIVTGNDERVSELRKWYERSMNPSESFFITVMRGHPQIRSGSRAMHYVRRDKPGDAHPLILDQDSYDDLRASPCFFARKFDAGSGALLDRIDHDALGFPISTRE